MRILFTNYEYPPLGGGGGVITAGLAQEMAKKHDVTVLTSQGPSAMEDSVEDGVRILRVPVIGRKAKSVASMISMLSYVPSGIRAGRQLLQRESFDIVNSHFVVPTGPVGDALARTAKVPHVTSILGGDVYDPSKLFSPHRHLPLRATVRQLLKRSDVVIGGSQNTIHNMRIFYGLDIYTRYIPLAIAPMPETGAADRADYGLSEDETVFVTLGRLVTRKNIPDLIETMNILRDKKAHLLIMGSGPERENLEALVAEYGVQEKVTFLGFVSDEDKPRILRMADVFVSSSMHEGFGLVFLEAMDCGLPVVCYNYGGQTDFLEDGRTGYTVSLGQVTHFAQACAKLIDNPELLREMSATSKARVPDYYINRFAESYEALFEETIQAYQQPQEAAQAAFQPYLKPDMGGD